MRILFYDCNRYIISRSDNFVIQEPSGKKEKYKQGEKCGRNQISGRKEERKTKERREAEEEKKRKIEGSIIFDQWI